MPTSLTEFNSVRHSCTFGYIHTSNMRNHQEQFKLLIILGLFCTAVFCDESGKEKSASAVSGDEKSKPKRGLDLGYGGGGFGGHDFGGHDFGGSGGFHGFGGGSSGFGGGENIGVHEGHISAITITKEKKIHVPVPYPVTVEKHVPYPVKVHVKVPVDRPYPVHVPAPYPVKVPVKVPYPVNVPYKVPYPVHKPVPYPVKVPVVVKEPYPVYIKEHHEHGEGSFGGGSFGGGFHGLESFGHH